MAAANSAAHYKGTTVSVGTKSSVQKLKARRAKNDKKKAAHLAEPKHPKSHVTAETHAAKLESLLSDGQHAGKVNQSETNKAADERTAINYASIIWIVLLHVGALAAPFYFTWEGLGLMLFMHWVTGCVGVTLGFHRLLTHSSFQTWKPVRYFLATVGGFAGEGDVIEWVANHRQHHAHSDQEHDPHSPRDGSWWSHMWWLCWTFPSEAQVRHHKRWAPDLVKDRGMVWVGRMFLPSQFILGGLFMAAGYGVGLLTKTDPWFMATSFVVWGVFVRMVAVLHTTWFVNSASHIWGYRNYETTDDSKNNWWVAIIAYGEGWHNNHHAWPRMAPHGHRWWEFDVTFRIIRLMQWTGLAWNVVDYKRKSEKVDLKAAPADGKVDKVTV
ncbi:Fatty acid desaturase [Anatilimnocola aggregata]|uniref:Fatty acid desaturase n=1 Tax=Anatilimnocola aggregata TaxID=2528021 RepID=A0A517YKJ2_9BACT|nr:fatty acid desaturase [Anatilimnocola aggregata]QDU30751.1 Fatty acid desaturase [Anatilimnocola aggregata]